MFDYLSENWATVVLVAGFVWLHLRMHRGHGGHGHGGSGDAHDQHHPQHEQPGQTGPGEPPRHEEEPRDHHRHRI